MVREASKHLYASSTPRTQMFEQIEVVKKTIFDDDSPRMSET